MCWVLLHAIHNIWDLKLSSHRKVGAIMVRCLAQGPSVKTRDQIHTLTTLELESGALDPTTQPLSTTHVFVVAIKRKNNSREAKRFLTSSQSKTPSEIMIFKITLEESRSYFVENSSSFLFWCQLALQRVVHRFLQGESMIFFVGAFSWWLKNSQKKKLTAKFEMRSMNWIKLFVWIVKQTTSLMHWHTEGWVT